MATNFAIEADHINRTFRTRNGETVFAVRDVSFRVAGGQIFGLLGPNGAGKTTIVRILTTILRPDSGSVRILGHDIRKNPLEVRRNIAVVLQETAVEALLSVRDNLLVYALLHGMPKSEAEKKIEPLMERFALKEHRRAMAQELSMGTRRRLQVAKIFLVNSPVVFLDEATTGMDPIIKRNTLDDIKALAREGRTIFLTTQLLQEAEILCDEISIINRGSQIATGNMQALRSLTQKRFHISMIMDDPVPAREYFQKYNLQSIQIQGHAVEMTVLEMEPTILKALAEFSQITEIEHFEMRAVDLEDIFVELINISSGARNE